MVDKLLGYLNKCEVRECMNACSVLRWPMPMPMLFYSPSFFGGLLVCSCTITDTA